MQQAPSPIILGIRRLQTPCMSSQNGRPRSSQLQLWQCPARHAIVQKYLPASKSQVAVAMVKQGSWCYLTSSHEHWLAAQPSAVLLLTWYMLLPVGYLEVGGDLLVYRCQVHTGFAVWCNEFHLHSTCCCVSAEGDDCHPETGALPHAVRLTALIPAAAYHRWAWLALNDVCKRVGGQQYHVTACLVLGLLAAGYCCTTASCHQQGQQ